MEALASLLILVALVAVAAAAVHKAGVRKATRKREGPEPKQPNIFDAPRACSTGGAEPMATQEESLTQRTMAETQTPVEKSRFLVADETQAMLQGTPLEKLRCVGRMALPDTHRNIADESAAPHAGKIQATLITQDQVTHSTLPELLGAQVQPSEPSLPEAATTELPGPESPETEPPATQTLVPKVPQRGAAETQSAVPEPAAVGQPATELPLPESSVPELPRTAWEGTALPVTQPLVSEFSGTKSLLPEAAETERPVRAPTAPKRPRPSRTLERRPEAAKKPEVRAKPEKRLPIQRGGKARGSTSDRQKKQPEGLARPRARPEIVCWKRDRQWVFAVAIPEELLEKSGLTVLESGFALARDELEKGCWLLKQLPSRVTVRWDEDDSIREARVEIGLDEYLLFKLSGNDLERGRLVKLPSRGPYLVIVPERWDRDQELSGPPPALPEPVDFAGYQAHFFDLDNESNQKIAFRRPDGQRLVIEANTRRFELTGNRLNDASDHMGPLFGERPPRIRAPTAEAWKSVVTIVVGQEGSGRGRWRKAFSPSPGQAEQDLPSNLKDRKGGWYFVRFYDSDDVLLESMDFRFLSVLREIRLPGLLHVPTADGYKPICVELIHDADCVVKPLTELAKIHVEYQDGKTLLHVPPDWTCDESKWLMGPRRGPTVEVTINVGRVWWALGVEHTPPAEWQDRPVLLSGEDLKAVSDKSLWLRFSRAGCVDKVFVGFERTKSRSYKMTRDKTVVVPLREYTDCIEVGDKTREHYLRVWIQHNQQDREIEIAVGVLSASQGDTSSVSTPPLLPVASSQIRARTYKPPKVSRPEMLLRLLKDWM